MKKFIIVSFMVLGWSYYEMSGGSDFAPERRETDILAAAEPAAPRVPIRAGSLTGGMTGNAPDGDIVLSAAPATGPETIPAVATVIEDDSARIASVESAPPPEPEFVSLVLPRAETRVVTANSLNVRLGPSTADPVIGRLTRGEEVAVALADAGNGWTMIRIEGDGIEGWVSTRFLSP